LEPPDPLEKKIRFGCGFVFGLLITGLSGFLWLLTTAYSRGYYLLALSLVCALVFGLLAMRYGDRFWYSMRSWLWWWPWWF
jgi:hypothetical protein